MPPLRRRPSGASPEKLPSLVGTGIRWLVGLLVAITATTVGVPTAPAGSSPVPPSARPVPPLASAVLTQALPGFTAVPVGPTNGPLTATEFASQSSNPQQADRQFAMLTAQPGFGAFIRLWTDRGGPGQGANDLAVLVFRIPDTTAADSFTSGLLVPFDGLRAAVPFAVPSVPGARGYSIQVTTPVDATEQVVVFRAGRYVSMLQLASTTSASNPAPLTRSQAITVSYQQYELVRQVDPVGSAPTVPRPVGRPKAATGSPAPARDGADRLGPVWLAGSVLVAVLAALTVLWAIRRRRRVGPTTASPTPATSVDPWGPDGVFAAFGAVEPTHPDVDEDHRDHREPPVPDLTAGAGRPGPPRAVPALVPSVVHELVDTIPVAEPARR